MKFFSLEMSDMSAWRSKIDGELYESSMDGEIVVTADKKTKKTTVEFVEGQVWLPI